jgi:hypothetical protein
MKNKERKTFEEVMAEFKTLGEMMQRMVRNVASMELQEWGAEEIGSSDINHQIVSLYNSYEGFDNIIRHGLDLVRSR